MTLRFSFTVNHSFLTWSNHPITVPKTQIDYAELERQHLSAGALTVVAPDGSSLSAEMYSGTAGFGPYYQIRVVIPEHHMILRLPVGFPLLVELERSQDMSWARIKPALPPEQLKALLEEA